MLSCAVCLVWLLLCCRGFKLQGSFLLMGIHAAAIAAAKAADPQIKTLWALSSGLLFAIFPYTMVVLMPTTKRILRQVGH